MKSLWAIAILITVVSAAGCKTASDSKLKELQVEVNGRMTIIGLDASDKTNPKVIVRACDPAVVDAAIEEQIDQGISPGEKPLALDFSKCTIKDQRYVDLPLSLYQSLLMFKLGARNLDEQEDQIRRAFFDLKSFARRSAGEKPDQKKEQIDVNAQIQTLDVNALIGGTRDLTVDELFDGAAADREVQNLQAQQDSLGNYKDAFMRADYVEIANQLLSRVEGLYEMKKQYYVANQTLKVVMNYIEKDSRVVSEREKLFGVAVAPFARITELGGLEKFRQATQSLRWELPYKEITSIGGALDACQGGRFPDKDELLAQHVAAQLGGRNDVFQGVRDEWFLIQEGLEFDEHGNLKFQAFNPWQGAILAETMTQEQLLQTYNKLHVICIKGSGEMEMTLFRVNEQFDYNKLLAKYEVVKRYYDLWKEDNDSYWQERYQEKNAQYVTMTDAYNAKYKSKQQQK